MKCDIVSFATAWASQHRGEASWYQDVRTVYDTHVSSAVPLVYSLLARVDGGLKLALALGEFSMS